MRCFSGAFKGNRKSGGLTGTVELTDAEGSVAVLDVNNGVICGLDVVVWPEVTTSAALQVPARLTDGRVVLPARPSRPGVASVEVDTTLSVETNGAESVFHLRIGAAPRGRGRAGGRQLLRRGGSAGWPGRVLAVERAAVHGVRRRDVGRGGTGRTER